MHFTLRTYVSAIPPANQHNQTWLEGLQRSLELQKEVTHPFHEKPYELQGIEVLSYDIWKSNLGFFTMHVALQKGDKVEKNTIFMRGPYVAMLVMLTPYDESGEGQEELKEKWKEDRYVLLVEQPRFAASSLMFRELPAGMIDDGEEPVVAAAREIEEETGLTVPPGELLNLTEMAMGGAPDSSIAEREKLPEAIYPSAGGCDENMTCFAYERKITRKGLEELDGRHKGIEEENERTIVRVVPMRDLVKEGIRDSKVLNAKALWDHLKSAGKV